MDSQIENAIEIAWNPASDPALMGQALQFVHQLRTDPQAWHVCASLFARTQPRAPSEIVRHVCLEVVNSAIHTQNLDGASLLFLKDTFLGYVRAAYGGPEARKQADGSGGGAPGRGGTDGAGQDAGGGAVVTVVDSPNLQNKLAQTLTYLFVVLYKDAWVSYFDDFLALTGLPGTSQGQTQQENVSGVFFYLRILSSVHDEIADMLLSRQGSDAKRNAELKDLLRARDVPKVAKSLQEILAVYGTRNDAVVEMTMKIIGKWVSWIDISLVVNPDMLAQLLPIIGRNKPAGVDGSPPGTEDKARDAAIDAFTEIVGKKMKAQDKVDMIVFLNLHQIVSELIASPPLNDFKGTPRYDTDLAEAVAKLVNTVVADLVRVLEGSGGAQAAVPDETRARGEQLLHDFVPLLLRFFSDEYDEICSTVIPSLTDLLTYLRKVEKARPRYADMLPAILNAIILKMRYDETSTWGNEDEQTDEAEFQELRKKLQNLQKSVAAVDQSLYIDVLSNLVAGTFQTLEQRGSQMDWRDVDLALHEMHLFGELTLPNSGITSKNQPNNLAVENLAGMMRKMLNSGVANFPHPAIMLQYMELCVRYSAFFENETTYIPQVLENFVRLVHHDHVRVKTRSWYLFHRFVKQLRKQVGNVAETVIRAIGDLLPIKAEVPGEDADDDMSSDESDHSADALFTSQLYLFEAIGCMASTGATPADKQALYARSVMDPLFADMEVHLPRAKAGDAQATLQIHHIIMALGTLAHGFSESTPGSSTASHATPPAKLVSDEFSRAAEAILVALGTLNSSAEIRTACRSSFSRLLGVLGSAVLPQLPQWIEGFLSQSSSKDEMAMFLRLLDQVVHGFKTEIYNVLDILLTPLLQRVLTGLAEPVTGTDDEIQLAELRREYLSFLQVILNNDLGGVLISETNQAFFESVISSVITLARTISGPVTGNLVASRLGFSVLTLMATLWGGPVIADISGTPSPPHGQPAPLIPGFDAFLLERFHGVCWEVLRDPNFRPAQDAQSRQVLVEIAHLEQVIYERTGDAFIASCQQHVFPADPDGQAAAASFLNALATGVDRRTFVAYLQAMLKGNR